jgi:hypothetical protein
LTICCWRSSRFSFCSDASEEKYSDEGEGVARHHGHRLERIEGRAQRLAQRAQHVHAGVDHQHHDRDGMQTVTRTGRKRPA